MEEKKRRTLLVINRHRLRLEEEERQRKLQEQREKRQTCERNWLSLALFAVVGGEMLAKMKIRKAELQEKMRRNTAAAFIQAQVRKRYQRVSGTVLIETRVLNSLKLFHAQVGPLVKLIAGKRILQHLRTGARNNHLQNTFTSFYRRVNLIQRLWRVYQQKEKERWKTLVDLWGKTVESLLAEANQKFPGKKGARKRQEAMDRYLGVPTSQRNMILRSYYKSYKLQYREKVREYIRHSYHERAFKAAKAFQYFLSMRRRESADNLLMAPMFQYLPDEEKMRELVEQTSNKGEGKS